MRLSVCALLFLVSVSSSAIAFDQKSGHVSFREKQPDQLEVLIGDDVFTVLNHGKTWSKPFLYPMIASNGKNVLRPIIPTAADQGPSKDGNDHFHHKGVWVSVDSVNEQMLNYWSEKEKIVCDKVSHTVNKDGSGQLVLNNTWVEAGHALVKETTTVTIYPSRLLVYQIQLSAVDKDVTIYDTKEGFFAVRVAHTMREMNGGFIQNAEGVKGEKDCWGKPSPWIDYYGKVDDATCGVTLMDDPANFRKSRYHVRSYGLFAISPFGPKKYSNGVEQESPVTLSAGKAGLKLRYGLYIHDGDTEAGKVTESYQNFLKTSAKQ